MPTDLVEGWSAAIPFTLKGDNVALDLTGLTVTLVLKDRQGGVVNTAGKVATITPSAGTVTFTPVDGDLKASLSPYSARFVLTDTNSKVLYVPNGAADEWKVRVP